jgi:spermidine/putrescine transport system substrate-binding protein
MNNKLIILVLAILIIVFTVLAVLYVNKLSSNTTSSARVQNNGQKLSSNDSTSKPSRLDVQDEKIDYVEEINVYNAAEYMDMNTIKNFEKEFKIKVNYKEFDSNESMYKDVASNKNKYDVLIPSDYMIDRLIKEDLVEKFNKANIPNIANIAEEYLNPEYDKNNEYVVPYMVGTVGILYNKSIVKETVDSWNILWDERYKGQIWLWDSMRDVIGVSLKRLGYSMNSTNDAELNEAKQALIKQKDLLRGFAEEEVRDSMIADEGSLALVYAGEAKSAIDQNPNLAYVIPNEGSNKFVDGFVIVKGTSHKTAAEKFINYMCQANIAIRNMTETGYTSPVKGAWAEFGDNKIMFPQDSELARCEAFLYDAGATEKYNKIWNEVR